MRAAVLKGPQKIEIAEAVNPAPDGKHVIVKVSACGICGSDLHYFRAGVGMDGRPGLIMGHEFCGTVNDPGERSDLSPGQRVTVLPLDPCGECRACAGERPNICTRANRRKIPGNNSPGAFAEYIAARPDMVRPLPQGVSDAEAVLIEPSAVALHAVNMARLSPKSSLLVVGAGPIGLLCASLARLKTSSLVAIAETDPFRLEAARGTGLADTVLDTKEGGAPKIMKEISGGGFDAAIETSAKDAGLTAAISALRPGGLAVLVGISYAPQAVNTLMLTVREVSLHGSMAYLPEEFDAVIGLMAQRKHAVEKLVTRMISLDEIPEAFTGLSSGRWHELKVIATP